MVIHHWILPLLWNSIVKDVENLQNLPQSHPSKKGNFVLQCNVFQHSVLLQSLKDHHLLIIVSIIVFIGIGLLFLETAIPQLMGAVELEKDNEDPSAISVNYNCFVQTCNLIAIFYLPTLYRPVALRLITTFWCATKLQLRPSIGRS